MRGLSLKPIISPNDLINLILFLVLQLFPDVQNHSRFWILYLVLASLVFIGILQSFILRLKAFLVNFEVFLLQILFKPLLRQLSPIPLAQKQLFRWISRQIWAFSLRFWSHQRAFKHALGRLVDQSCRSDSLLTAI